MKNLQSLTQNQLKRLHKNVSRSIEESNIDVDHEFVLQQTSLLSRIEKELFERKVSV